MKTFRQQLLESGLARIHNHLSSGRSLGIISAATGKDPKEDEDSHRKMIKRLREHGYGPIQATGRSQWGVERSLVVPNARLEDLKKIGNEFKQQTIIHIPEGGKKNAALHWLDAGGDKVGTKEEIGSTHFNKPSANGVTILKGIGYNIKDTKDPTRSFAITNEGIIESLIIPRGGQLHPLEKPYT